MGGYSGLPALAIRPPESPLQQVAQAQQIVGQRQTQQLQQLEIQQQTRNLADQDAATRAMAQWDGNDYSALPGLVKNAGGSANAVMAMTKNIFDMKAKASEIAKNDALTNQSNVDTLVKQNDGYRGRLLNIVGITDPEAKQAAWAAEIAKEQAAGTQIPPGVTSQYPGDAKATVLANSFALGSTLVKEADDRQRLALDAWKSVGGQLVNAVTGEKIGGLSNIEQLNKALETRWQQGHPGEALPDQFKLPPTATPQDFERIDKVMEGTEREHLTTKQQEIVNAMRQQTFDMQMDKAGLKPVQGTDPRTGRTVQVPYAQAVKMGIPDAAEVPSQDYQKTLSARHWLVLANKRAPEGAEPSEMGITQLIDKMDKDGKLGPLAGRWNEFMTGTYGAGDADYAALKAKIDLSSTLLGAVHTGRLGPYLLENLASLADAKKMDGPTLKSAFNAEVNYVNDRALDPNPPTYAKPTPSNSSKPSGPPPGATHTVFNRADGKQHWTDDKNSKDLGVAE